MVQASNVAGLREGACGWSDPAEILRQGRMPEVIVFKLGSERCLLPLAKVVEVAPMLKITPIAGVESPVRGYVEYRGTPIAVVDLGLRLGLKVDSEVHLDEHLIVARLGERRVALRVDRVLGLEHHDALPQPLELSASPLAGIISAPDGSLFVLELEELLSLEQRRSVADALSALGAERPTSAA